jgi:hypothetical protein
VLVYYRQAFVTDSSANHLCSARITLLLQLLGQRD